MAKRGGRSVVGLVDAAGLAGSCRSPLGPKAPVIPYAIAPRSRRGAKSVSAGNTDWTVATDTRPPPSEPNERDITSACAGRANADTTAGSAGPAIKSAAARKVATPG